MLEIEDDLPGYILNTNSLFLPHNLRPEVQCDSHSLFSISALQRFMPNAFEDFSSLCQKEGKVAKFLDIEKPAVYVRSGPARIVDQI